MSDTIIHMATCVAIGGRALLIEGSPGSGKSTLALQLIDRGAILIGDDAVKLQKDGGRLIAVPPPNIAGKIEIRNVGIVELPVTSAQVSLILRLAADAPRFVETANYCEIAGCRVPFLLFDPAIAAAPIRAEYALDTYGVVS